MVSDPAAAATMCGDREEILARLQQRHEESPTALGLSSDGGVLEVLVSPEGGWTILITYPKRPTCVVAVGEAWQTLQRPASRRDPGPVRAAARRRGRASPIPSALCRPHLMGREPSARALERAAPGGSGP